MDHMLLAASWGEAQQQVQQAGSIAWGSGASATLPQMIGRIVNVVLSLLGLVFLGLALYGGFRWMTARGNEKAVTEAQDTMRNAIIGILITATAYTITSFVMARIMTIAGG